MHGLGASRLAAVGTALGVRTVAELRDAAAAGRLQGVPGVGPHTEARIVAALAAPAAAPRAGLMLNRARALSGAVAAALDGIVAGDVRRWVDRPERLAVVVPAAHPEDARARSPALPEIVAMLAPDVGVSVDGVPVELVVAPHDAARHGARPRDRIGRVRRRARAAARGRDRGAGLRAAGPRPRAPGAARAGRARAAPRACWRSRDVRGDLHCHTTWSDGRAGVREMAEAARARGYEYLAICDHTRAVSVVPGLDADDLRRQAGEIEAANAALAPVPRPARRRVRHPPRRPPRPAGRRARRARLGADLAPRRPARRRDDLTARVVHAMHHPAARCLSHPTGRIIGHRAENALDLERTFEAALETGVALEVNGLASRLDLSAESRPRGRGRGRADRVLERRPLDRRARQHDLRRPHRPPRRGAGRGGREHEPGRRPPPPARSGETVIGACPADARGINTVHA